MTDKNLWEKFNNVIDVTGLASDIEKAADNTASYREVPHGTYEVGITKLELTESKKGDPMVTAWFKIVDGEYKDSLIFMNQVITQGFQVHIVNEILRQIIGNLETITVEFRDYAQYGDLLMDIFEAVSGIFEFKLAYLEGKKGFSTYQVTEVYVLE